MEAITQNNITHAVTLAEVEVLKKIVDVSETSYKELVAAIDNERENINNTPASKVQQLEDEIQRLHEKSKNTGVEEAL